MFLFMLAALAAVAYGAYESRRTWGRKGWIGALGLGLAVLFLTPFGLGALLAAPLGVATGLKARTSRRRRLGRALDRLPDAKSSSKKTFDES